MTQYVQCSTFKFLRKDYPLIYSFQVIAGHRVMNQCDISGVVRN
jgi:hypothetical protein